MQLKIDMQILAMEPQPDGLTLIEARAPDGTGLLVSVRVAEPLTVGGWMTMALFAEPAAAAQPAAPSMRERMQAGARGVTAAGQAPRSAATAGSVTAAGQAPHSAVTAGSITAAGQAPRSAATAGSAAAPRITGDASSLLLSSILGSRAAAGKTSDIADIMDNSPLVERNVDDEMDALLGAPPRKG